MSYILEALKKSQQERELGRVPRLQAGPFEEPDDRARNQPWAQAAVGLALVAVVLAAYAALRPAGSDLPATQAPETAAAEPALPAAEAQAPAASAPEAPEASSGRSASASEAPGPTKVAAAAASASADASAAAESDETDYAPQVLVVPAPPRPGERLPRGADELRRALLGPDAAPPIEAPAQGPLAEPMRPDYAPAPPDLIAEIEQFKRSVQAGEGAGAGAMASSAAAAGAEDREGQQLAKASTEQGSDRARADRATAASAPPASGASGAATAPRPPALSSALRRELPSFSMTVHVYDPDPKRRFVYLNGSKVREGETTRDGFMVERVVADGAVFRYEDYRFFQAP